MGCKGTTRKLSQSVKREIGQSDGPKMGYSSHKHPYHKSKRLNTASCVAHEGNFTFCQQPIT